MPLNALPPDQRAVVQLVLTRDRSYAQIAELLKISEDAVRARAHKGLSALAPEVELPADKLAQVADFLLGQQNGKPRQATRRLLRSSNGAREWAETVRAQLADVSGASLPELPRGQAARRRRRRPAEPVPPSRRPSRARAEAAPVDDEPAAAPAPRPRPLRDKPRTPAASGPRRARPDRRRRRVLAARRGGADRARHASRSSSSCSCSSSSTDDDKKPATSASATPTPTASATPAPVGEIPLKATKGNTGSGVMRLYTAQQQLAFTLEGTDVPPSRRPTRPTPSGSRRPGGAAQRLGFAQPVGANGQLGTTGPRTEDLDKFPRWLATFKQVVVSRESDGKAKKPGPAVLVGTLPSAAG